MCDCNSCTQLKLSPLTFTNKDVIADDLRKGRVIHIGYTADGSPLYRYID